MAPSNGYFLYENHSLELLDLVTLLRVKQHTPKIGLFVAFCSLKLSSHGLGRASKTMCLTLGSVTRALLKI